MTLFLDEKKRRIWAGSVGLGLLEFSMETHAWQRHDLHPPGQNDPRNNFVNAIQPGNDSTLWLATEAGPKVFSITRNQCAGFNLSPTQTWEALCVPHYALFRDRAGTIWFGTDKGLSRLDPHRQQFPADSPLPDEFEAQALAEYAPSNERLFAAWDRDGFFRVFAQHQLTGHIRRARQRLPFRPNDVAAVHQLFVAPDHRIWVLLNRGIGWLDPATLRLTIPDLPIANHPVCRTAQLWPRHITADTDGNLWIATFGSGLIRFTPSTGQFWRPATLPRLNRAQREFNEFISSVYCDPAGRIFMGENGTGLEGMGPG